MTILRAAAAVAAALLTANCATVTRGVTNQVQVTSEPPGASVRTSLAHNCVTPCTLQIDRKAEFEVSYTLAGYRDATVAVKTQLAGAGAAGFAGNILVGGVIGMGVDVATGATLEHTPNPVHAVLEPVGKPKPGQAKRMPKPLAAPPPKAEPEEPAPVS